MAPVAVPTTGVDELKIDEPKVEKKVDINEEDDDEEDEAEGEGGETGATGGTPFYDIMQSILIISDAKKKKKKKKCMLHQNWICKADQ
jgi:hypothetical protein